MATAQTLPMGVVGQAIELAVDSDDALELDVAVTFTCAWDDDEDRRVLGSSWQETLRLAPCSADATSGRTFAYRAPWVIHLPEGTPRHSIELVAELRLVLSSPPPGKSRVHKQLLEVPVGVVGVTQHPALERIMLHEHARREGGAVVFDRAALEAHVDALTIEQRRVLFRDEPGDPAHRLVAFVTLTPRDERRMGADFAPGGCVKPNASFALFHRDRARRRVTLVCFTRYFLVNGGVVEREPQDGKPPDEWLRRDNPKPPMWKLLVLAPMGEGTDGLVWSRIVSPSGRDVLLGNTLHGIINTHGCWMLFRNFNWPQKRYVDFDRIYRRVHRPRAGRAAVEKALAAVGYDVTAPPDGQSSSYDKFLLYDRNFAYLWAMHDLVGVRYLAGDFTYASRGVGAAKDPGRRVHDHETHGLNFAATFPLDKIWQRAPTATPEEGNYVYHDLDRRHAEDRARKVPPFTVEDSLIGENVLGFKAAQRFCRAITGDVSAKEAKETSWADLHVYREDGLALADWRVVYVEGPALDVVVKSSADGKPLAGADVRLSLDDHERRGRSDDRGVARFVDLPRAGAAKVRASHPGCGDGAEVSIVIHEGEDNQFELILTPSALALAVRWPKEAADVPELVFLRADWSEAGRLSNGRRDGDAVVFDLVAAPREKGLTAVLMVGEVEVGHRIAFAVLPEASEPVAMKTCDPSDEVG